MRTQYIPSSFNFSIVKSKIHISVEHKGLRGQRMNKIDMDVTEKKRKDALFARELAQSSLPPPTFVESNSTILGASTRMASALLAKSLNKLIFGEIAHLPQATGKNYFVSSSISCMDKLAISLNPHQFDVLCIIVQPKIYVCSQSPKFDCSSIICSVGNICEDLLQLF